MRKTILCTIGFLGLSSSAYAGQQYVYPMPATGTLLPPVASSSDIYTSHYAQPELAPAPVITLPPPPSSPPVYVQQEPAYVPPASKVAADPVPSASFGLQTRSGLDLGVQGFYYDYHEPSVGVEIKGPKFGLTAAGTYAFHRNWFASVNGRFAYGSLDYKGSGTNKDEPDYQWNIDVTAGRDFTLKNFTISPYAGVGYRELYNDGRGTSSTGAIGYRRDNQLIYLPLGIMPRFSLGPNSRIATKFEGDVVLYGTQKSHLEDVASGTPTLTNHQNGGYGLKTEIMYERSNWSIGPFFNYWNIDESDRSNFVSNSAGVCAGFGQSAPCTLSGKEPHNYTLETGVQFKYHFW